MFKIKKIFEVAIAHKLDLPYESKCKRLHGHELKITIYCAANKLDPVGMVIDFTEIKKKIHDKLDHRDLNEIEEIGYEVTDKETEIEFLNRYKQELNPTAERLAEWICSQFPACYRVDVQESTGNVATYEDEDFWLNLHFKGEG